MSVKMVFVYRRDLKMRKGKMAAMVGHATQHLALRCFYKHIDFTFDKSSWHEWNRFNGSKKVVLSCDDLEALRAIEAAAKKENIPYHVVEDTGKTEFHGERTVTLIGLGPFNSDIIDTITGPDGLVKCKLA